tara:strand:+ start:259 stop:702 length:444 start_codon:yes stop_codon:yes gene_type:complete
MKPMKRICAGVMVALLGASITGCGSSKPRQADLPRQPDRWVGYIKVDPESKVSYIGKTKNLLVTSASTVADLKDSRPIKIGDTIQGIKIGAIKCSFHWNDSGYGNNQFMWRGKWGCMAGRSKFEINNAINDNGKKIFDYIYVAPVSI